MTVVNIHASCVVCARAGAAFGVPEDAGVLLLGESGSGKSEAALRLIAIGAKLVADDRCELLFDGYKGMEGPAFDADGNLFTVATRQNHLIRWTDAGMNFIAVSDLNVSELEEFARLIRQADPHPTDPVPTTR